MFDVYCATSPSGKRYVGVTARGEAQRWAEHELAARNGVVTPLYHAIRKYGAPAFQRTLLERMSTQTGAHRAERLWIAELGTFGPGGYKSTAGGEGMLGYHHTSDARARISTAHKGRVSPMRGRKHSPETRALIAAANTGNPPTRGMTGKVPTLEHRARAAAAWTPEMRAAHSARAKVAGLGTAPPSAETREKMRAAKLGRKLSEETRAKMSAAQLARHADRKKPH